MRLSSDGTLPSSDAALLGQSYGGQFTPKTESPKSSVGSCSSPRSRLCSSPTRSTRPSPPETLHSFPTSPTAFLLIRLAPPDHHQRRSILFITNRHNRGAERWDDEYWSRTVVMLIASTLLNRRGLMVFFSISGDIEDRGAMLEL
nr:hypothetical protein Iba_chr10dCG10120 [Ipomoea batatas]